MAVVVVVLGGGTGGGGGGDGGGDGGGCKGVCSRERVGEGFRPPAISVTQRAHLSVVPPLNVIISNAHENMKKSIGLSISAGETRR